ncbi:hypothetical protein BCR44DRAFT_36968 [Catenaria anguillulae PL171]|uniref:CHCH domain-containing protein n=1 Tax=Catenaria anguillulae PL171 TaxID=765915 RepID=A0A1Y2HZX2_9FUNG|nr:hypothetical protein BCR44DRAFT_36968 [Catenaria anguillulae PL171]
MSSASPKGQREHGQAVQDDEEDPYDARIRRSGCASEHEALQDCHFATKDYRKCTQQLLAFKECWKRTHPPDNLNDPK